MSKWIKNPNEQERAQIAAESAAKRERLVNLLKQGVAAIQTTEDFKRMLVWQSRFHRYSFGNMMLIWMQRPEATRVAGFKTWIELGRTPLAGRSIGIRAPQAYHKRDENGEKTDDMGLTFKVVPVWDIADTVGDAPPMSGWHPTEGDGGTELYNALRAFVTKQGWKWEEYTRESERESWGTAYPESKRIRVAVNATPLTAFETAVHEMGHGFDPDIKTSPNDRAEALAEGVAFVVLHHFGFETDAAFEYIAGHAGRKDAGKLIESIGSQIQKIAESIIEGIESELKQQARVEKKVAVAA